MSKESEWMQVWNIAAKESKNHKVRKFEGGATRDIDDHKPEFGGYLSPIVLRRFGAYMLKHQNTAAGRRGSDNWKAGMPRRVYLESLLRHTMDVWEGVTDDHIGVKPDIEEALCAVIFNAQGLLREILKNRNLGEKEDEQASGSK